MAWMHLSRRLLAPLSALFVACGATTPQGVDEAYRPQVERPTWQQGVGPVVAIDAAHYDFHVADGRFAPYARLLAADGFRVVSSSSGFQAASLDGVSVLVVANALHADDADPARWALPIRSAFGLDEVEAVRSWVAKGGSLLLIADHMPFPAAAADLASAFGFDFQNGFAVDAVVEQRLGHTGRAARQPASFRRGAGLADHAITRGLGPHERVEELFTFTGSSFTGSPPARPLITLGRTWVNLYPEVVWRFETDTRRESAAGMHQAATVVHGKGRVAVFAEAGMFTAQHASDTGKPMGLNHPDAVDNAQFVLNVMHWLVGMLE